MQRILERWKTLLSEVDRWFARSMELYPEAISCGSGCSACCRSLFDITLLDAWYLKRGFEALPAQTRVVVLQSCRERLAGLRERWPEFAHPYQLNYRPEAEWGELMPDEDETPCVLLDGEGRCLVYENRPMTCRLHGLPMIDTDGEVMHDEWCSMNFADRNPLQLSGLDAPFDRMLREEVAIFRDFTGEFLKRRMSELDTLIPTALLIDFDGFDWQEWLADFTPAGEA